MSCVKYFISLKLLCGPKRCKFYLHGQRFRLDENIISLDIYTTVLLNGLFKYRTRLYDVIVCHNFCSLKYSFTYGFQSVGTFRQIKPGRKQTPVEVPGGKRMISTYRSNVIHDQWRWTIICIGLLASVCEEW